MEQFEKIDVSEFVEKMSQSTKNLYLSLPSIEKKIAETLIRVKKEKPTIKIKVVIDNSEEPIRNGFGDIEGIDILKENGIQMFELSGNLISFIICDEVGYFIFPYSRIFDKVKGKNAFRIDPASIKLLIYYFFQSEEKTDNKEFEQIAIIGDANRYFKDAFKELENIKPEVAEFDNEKHGENKKKLENDPPLQPDLQRKIKTYSTMIQFVELKFNGGNFQNKVISLPQNVIPISSEELKKMLKIKINIFKDLDEKKEYKKMKEFKEKLDKLRKDYLKPINCRPNKSIIKKDQKQEFLNKLDEMKNELKEIDKMFEAELEKERLNAIDLLKEELYNFLKKNEPDEVKKYEEQDVKERKIKEIVEKTILRTKFPEVNKLIEKMSLTEHFYELTWEDFKDEKLIKEFKCKKIMEKKDIDEIVEMKKVFATKNKG